MESQTSLPIQRLTAMNPEVPRYPERRPDALPASGASFEASLSESIIDVYERPADNISVPDERRGVDRRICSNRRCSFSPSSPVPLGATIINAASYSAEQPANRVFQAKNIKPASFSSAQNEGSLIDTWA